MTTILRDIRFKTERDIILVDILSALLVSVIAFFPNSPARIILSLPFILFFPGYVLICALFPRRKDLDIVERLVLSLGLSIAVTSLIGLMLNYTPFGIMLYPVTFSLFLFILLISAAATYRRRIIFKKEVFAPLSQMSISGWRELGRSKSEFIKSENQNRIIKIIAIIAFIFITLALTITARTPPASGYELSIYKGVSPFVWLFLIGSIACGIAIITHQAFSKDKERDNFWLIGFLILILSNLIVTLFSVIRGYATFGRGDHLSHLGSVKDILSSGYININDFYPITHIFIAEITGVCGIPPIIVMGFVPALFTILYMASIYLLATVIFDKREYILLSAAASCTLFFTYYHVEVFPAAHSTLMLPLVFYLYFKISEKPSVGFSLVYIILLMVYPFFHPLTVLILILFLIMMEISKIIYTSKRSEIKFSHAITQISINPILIPVITFFMWFSAYLAFGQRVRSMASWLYGTVIGSSSDLIMSRVSKVATTKSELFELTIKFFGHQIIYTILSLIAVLIIFKFFYQNKKIKNLFRISVWFIITGLMILFSLLAMASSLTQSAQRLVFLNFMMLVTPLLAGFAFYELFKNRHRTISIAIIVAILVVSSTIGIFNLYPSPYLKQSSSQITNMELTGVHWFFNYKNVPDLYIGMGHIHRFSDAIYGYSQSREREDFSTFFPSSIPDHFDYANHTSLGELYAQDRYMVISKWNKALYLEVWPEIGRFNNSDFERVEDDSTVDMLYSNGELDVFFVKGISKSEKV
ncbi:hypothetical protein C4E22_01785 [ANME-1 cluster archaeon AG-394-G06]|nr:hypothetical protein [ANME-1 cluster archaeon AG-394-G06]